MAVLLVNALALLSGACSTTVRYGDGTCQKAGFLLGTFSPGVPMEAFWLPEFPIDRAGRYAFRVDEAPNSILPPPFPAMVRIRSEAGVVDPPWKSVELLVTVKQANGERIGSHRVVMKRIAGSQYSRTAPVGLDGNTVLERTQKRTSYEVVVEVIHPSNRKGDRAFLENYDFEIGVPPNGKAGIRQ